MNLTSPILKGAAHAAELPGNSVTKFLKAVGDSFGLFADDSPDGSLGMLMSGSPASRPRWRWPSS